MLGTYFSFVKEDFPKAFEALGEALRTAMEEKDIITVILASYWSGILQAFDCDFEQSKISLQRAVDINVAAKSRWGTAAQKAQLAYFCFYFPGKITSLTKLSSEALGMAQESGDPISRGISHTAYGFACYGNGHLEDAENHSREGGNLCERIGLNAWAGTAWICLAETYFEMKAYHKSRECYDQLQRSWQSVQILPSFVRWAQLGMARCGVMLGERKLKLEPLRGFLKKNKIKYAEGWMCRYLAEILLNLGGRHIAEAKQWMRKAIEADVENGIIFHLGLDHALFAEFFKRQGDRTRAQEELGKAAEILRECGADGWVKKYQDELTALL